MQFNPCNPKLFRGKKNFPCFQNTIQQNGHSYKAYMSARFEASQELNRTDLLGHYGCVNAIEFSNGGGEFIVSGGDDRRVLLWNLHKVLYHKEKPIIMKGQHSSNIFCTVFDGENRHLFSAGNDDLAMRHDILTRETLEQYFHDHPVYGINVHPDQENVFLTACDNGKVLLWDARNTSQSASQTIAEYHRSIAFHAAVFNPVDPVLIATANSSKGVQLWDIRFPKRVLHEFSSSMPKVCAMGVKWNTTGTFLSALRRRLPPALYSIEQTSALVEFRHSGYNNICTMKSHCFAGDKDQYIISGSDDFNVYVWKVPDQLCRSDKMISVDSARVLSGHRSIVNQVRFNPATHMIISAGVEKIIKVWSPWNLPGVKDDKAKKSRRELYSHDDYVDLVLDSGRPLTHEYEGGSVEEDPRMLAFFDTLIQREQGGWSDDSDSNLSDEDFSYNIIEHSSEASDSGSDQTLMASPPRSIDTPENDETSQAVLRRMRRLRRAAFLRSLVRRNEHQDEEANEHPADSQDVFRHHLREIMGEIMREAMETSSESSDNEPTVSLALPEELLVSDSNEHIATERVEFHRSRTRRTRQYRQRDSNEESSQSSNENIVQNRNKRRSRTQASSSSSDEDSHEDECRISQLRVKRPKRRELTDSENDSNEPSTSLLTGDMLFTSENNDISSIVVHHDPLSESNEQNNGCSLNSVIHNGHQVNTLNNHTKTNNTDQDDKQKT